MKLANVFTKNYHLPCKSNDKAGDNLYSRNTNIPLLSCMAARQQQ